MHYKDALKFHELAVNENSKLKSLYVRHSIISVVLALEALINRVLFEFCIFKSHIDTFEKLSIVEKWLTCPLVSGKEFPVGKTFDQSKEPFQSFKELVNIRNWFVHPKNTEFIPATKTPWTIHVEETDKTIPWVETEKGDVWPQTKIPRNPFELVELHSEKAIKVFESMKDNLLELFKDTFDEDWLWTLKLITTEEIKTELISIDSLWGGFTQDSED
jgi:hypothetical protein